MGIKQLHKFLIHHLPEDSKGIEELPVSSLKNKTCVIDISIFLYRYITGIRESLVDFYNVDNEVTTHIHAITNKVKFLLNRGIKPIFVFDGIAHEHKDLTLNERREKKNENTILTNEYKKELRKLFKIISRKVKTLEDVILIKEAFAEYEKLQKKYHSALQKSVNITRDQIRETKEILALMGIPFIESLEESDPQCAEIVKEGNAFAVISEDMDMLPFGATHLIRGLSGSKKTFIQYNLDIILKDLNITMDQFIDICIMLGCDYSKKIPGIGYPNIYKTIKKYKSIEKYLEDNPLENPKIFKYIEAREMFKNPVTITTERFTWSEPNMNKLKKILIDKYSFTKEQVSDIEKTFNSEFYCKVLNKKYIKPDLFESDSD